MNLFKSVCIESLAVELVKSLSKKIQLIGGSPISWSDVLERYVSPDMAGPFTAVKFKKDHILLCQLTEVHCNYETTNYYSNKNSNLLEGVKSH